MQLRTKWILAAVGAVGVWAQPAIDQRAAVRSWVQAHQQGIVRELLELLAIPNVAADRANIRKNAEHLQRMLAARGFARGAAGDDGQSAGVCGARCSGRDADAAALRALRRPAGRAEGVAAAESLPARAADRPGRSRRDRSGCLVGARQVRRRLADLRAFGVGRQGADRRGAAPRSTRSRRTACRRHGTSASSSTARKRRGRPASCRRSRSIATSFAPI